MAKQEVQEVEEWLSEPQTAVLSTRKQLILEMSGQGGGKSENIGYSSGMLISEFPEAFGFIGANTYLQLSQSTLSRVFSSWKRAYGYEEYDPKQAPWGAYVVDKKPPPHFQRFHKLRTYDGTISFFNGHISFIGSLENYKAHEGKEFAWAHLDETKDTKERALKDVILGRLRQYGLWFDREGHIIFNSKIKKEEADAQGWTAWNPLYIHTSPAIDGAEWIVKMFKLDKFSPEIKRKCQARENDFFFREFENKAVCIYSAFHNEQNLSPGFLQNQIINLGDEDKILKLVDGYPFGKSGGEYFPHFRRDKHVRPVPYIPGEPVLQTWDWNVVPYMTLLCCQLKYLTRYMDEVGEKHDAPEPGYHAVNVMRFSFYREYCNEPPRNSTEAVCEDFAGDHNPTQTEITYYGDANGLHRIPGLGSVTNFKIVEDALRIYMHNDSKKVRDPNVMPGRRRDLVNDILRGKYPEVEIEFDEEMIFTIADMENVKLGPKGKIKAEVEDPITKKKYQKYGHTSDAVEYLVSEVCKYLIDLK